MTEGVYLVIRWARIILEVVVVVRGNTKNGLLNRDRLCRRKMNEKTRRVGKGQETDWELRRRRY